MDSPEGTVQVYPGVDRPIAVPEEIVLEAQREYRAYIAHRSGESWAVIAEREHYASPAAARASVTRYLREGQILVEEYTKAEMLALEVARLNALQAAVWDGAMEGRIPAVMTARTIIMDRVKLLKLDDEADNNDLRARTVVIMGSGEEYSAALQRVAEQSTLP